MTFDGTNKIIILDSGITSYTATELYSEWKQWVISGVGASIEAAYSVSGNIPVGGGVATGAFFILINGWKIRPPEEDIIININGNFYSDDGFISIPTISNFNTQINVTRATDATVVQGGGGSNQDIEDIFDIVKEINIHTQPNECDSNEGCDGGDASSNCNVSFEGGSSATNYLTSQGIDAGSAETNTLPGQTIDAGGAE